MRQHDLEPRILVQRAGDDELGRRRGVLEGEAKGVIQVGRLRRFRRQPRLPSPEDVFVAVERVEQDRIPQFLDARQHRGIPVFEQVIVALDGVGQVDRPHARLPGHPVQFFQREGRIADRDLDGTHEPVGMGRVRLHVGVIDDLREAVTDVGRHPLPRHAA